MHAQYIALAVGDRPQVLMVAPLLSLVSQSCSYLNTWHSCDEIMDVNMEGSLLYVYNKLCLPHSMVLSPTCIAYVVPEQQSRLPMERCHLRL